MSYIYIKIYVTLYLKNIDTIKLKLNDELIVNNARLA